MGLEFAVAGSVDVGEGRAGGDQALGIGYSLGGPENFEELIGFTANPSEKAEFLENHCPGDQGEEQQQEQNRAGDPAGLGKNIENVADVDGGEKKNWENPSGKENF